MAIEIFNKQLERYAINLKIFTEQFRLPQEWFASPDHVAVKAADSAGYEQLVAAFQPKSEEITYVEMQGRRLAAARLAGPLAVGRFGDVSLVEIMEPKPEKVGRDIVGLEHMEFYYPNLTEVQDVLRKRGIANAFQENHGHAWINIQINNQGQELKINDRPLSEVLAYEKDHGLLKSL